MARRVAKTAHGLREVSIIPSQECGKDGIPVFKNDKPVFSGYEVLAFCNAPGNEPAHRSFGKRDTYQQARELLLSLPEISE